MIEGKAQTSRRKMKMKKDATRCRYDFPPQLLTTPNKSMDGLSPIPSMCSMCSIPSSMAPRAGVHHDTAKGPAKRKYRGIAATRCMQLRGNQSSPSQPVSLVRLDLAISNRSVACAESYDMMRQVPTWLGTVFTASAPHTVSSRLKLCQRKKNGNQGTHVKWG